MAWRLKAKVGDDENIFPMEFPSKQAVEDFLKTKVSAELIPDLMAQGVFEIYQESKILDRNGQPIKLTIQGEQ